jgi:uncharacterized protein
LETRLLRNFGDFPSLTVSSSKAKVLQRKVLQRKEFIMQNNTNRKWLPVGLSLLLVPVLVACGSLTATPNPKPTGTAMQSTPTTATLPAGVAAEDLTIDFGDGWVAKGQLTYPAGKGGTFPTVILVHGSGPNDMDHTIPEVAARVPGGSKMFRDIAYHLAEQGFATVRYHKRGIVELGPVPSTDSRFTQPAKPFTKYVEDTTFVLNSTLKHKLVDSKRVVLLGISEGSLVTSQVAISPAGKEVAGLVLLGTVGYDIKVTLQFQLVDREIMALQTQADQNKDGKVSLTEFLAWTSQQPAEFKEGFSQKYLVADSSSGAGYKFRPEIDRNGDNLLDLAVEARPFLMESSGMNKFPDVSLPPEYQNYVADIYQYGSVTTLLPAYRKPVLLLHGEADNATVVEGVRETKNALVKAGHPDQTLLIYPGLGHTLYPVSGNEQPLGSPQASVLKDLADWLNKRFKAGATG